MNLFSIFFLIQLDLLFDISTVGGDVFAETEAQQKYRTHVDTVWNHLLRQPEVLRDSNLESSWTESPDLNEQIHFYLPNRIDRFGSLSADQRLSNTSGQQLPFDDRSTSADHGHSDDHTCSSFVHQIDSSVIKEFKNVPLHQHLGQHDVNVSMYIPPLDYVKPNFTQIGQSNVKLLERLFGTASLNSIRNHEHNQALKQKAVQSINEQLSAYVLEVYNQEFTFKAQNGTNVTGTNVIAVIPSKQRHKLGDRILLIGAHYDTVKNSIGVDDNGSGVAALIELARLCSAHIGKFNNTIYFVAFDMQEQGILGSLAFVNQYLIPEEISAKKSKFIGAYIMDMVMNFDSRPRSQSLPLDIFTAVPDASSWVRLNGFKGDFLSVWSRKIIDWHLWNAFYLNWKEYENETGVENNVKLMPLDPPIPRTPLLISNWRYRSFMKSDHAAFWNHKNRAFSHSLNAVLLTDMGPWRGKQMVCYHNFCDDKDFLTQANLLFLKRIVDVLARTIALLAELY